MTGPAQGWYHDPYGVHQHRYFSAGEPTKLVRDLGQESYDPPPDEPLPDGELIPVQLTVPDHDEPADPPTIDYRRAALNYFESRPRESDLPSEAGTMRSCPPQLIPPRCR